MGSAQEIIDRNLTFYVSKNTAVQVFFDGTRDPALQKLYREHTLPRGALVMPKNGRQDPGVIDQIAAGKGVGYWNKY